MNIDEIRLVEKEMRKIVPIFLTEFIEYVPVAKRMYLKDQENLCQVIGFESGIGAWCRENNIYFAIQNANTFKRLSKKQGYGEKKGTLLVAEDEWMNNDKDYLDYFDYALDNGLKEIDYCLDILPHEIMHLIGCGDGIIGEGITELRTREVCKKHGIRCAPILHSKEVKLVQKLARYFNEMELNEACFFHNFTVLLEKCDKVFGEGEFTKVYRSVSSDYRDYTMDRFIDPFVHYQKYRDLDFSEIYRLLDSKELSELK